MSTNSFLSSKRGSTSTFTASASSTCPKKINAFLSMNDTATASDYHKVAVDYVVAAAVASHDDEYPQLLPPQLRVRATATTATATTATATTATATPRAVLNYKASLLTAIDDRMLEEQERMRRTQRKDAEAKREIYEKLKYDDDRAAIARAAFEPDYTSNSTLDSSLTDDGEEILRGIDRRK